MSDAVRPNHYKSGGLEPFEIMKIKMTHEQYTGFLLGNVIKYVLRYQDKNGVEDLKKARQYLEWLIQEQPVPEPTTTNVITSMHTNCIHHTKGMCWPCYVKYVMDIADKNRKDTP